MTEGDDAIRFMQFLGFVSTSLVDSCLDLTPSVSLTLEERLTYSELSFAGVSTERLDSLFRVGFTYVF